MTILNPEFVSAPDAVIIPGSMQRLGRLPAIDERSKQARFAMSAPKPTRSFRNWLSPKWRHWSSVLDQGATSQCVAYAATKFLLTHPIVNRPRDTPQVLYDRAQRLDEWEGTNYDGTSVNAGMKALREDGLISAWTWAFEVEPIIRHILEVGPVVVGTDWTDGMFSVDGNGYIWPSGRLVGGHGYLLVCANNNRVNPDGTIGAVRKLGSWGSQWGQKGRAWITYGVLNQLMKGLSHWPGEAAAPIEEQLPR